MNQPETCKYTGGSCCWPIDQCAERPNHGCKWLQDCVCCNAYCDAVADFVSAEYCEKCKFYDDQAGIPRLKPWECQRQLRSFSGHKMPVEYISSIAI